MKKLMTLLLALCLSVMPLAAFGEAAQEDGASDFGVFPAVAGESGTTYVNLFEVIVTDEWYDEWLANAAAAVGETAAPELVAGLQGSITSELYGEEAAAAFENGGYAFDCWYINGARAFTFKDDTVTVLKDDGSEETHTYEYLGVYNVGDGESMSYMGQEISVAFPCDVYKSTDEAGEFNYILLRDDTMEETFHIEFRYGSDLEALQGYFVGPYAFWLAAGIDAEADEAAIRNVIALFCLENVDLTSHNDEALAQLASLGFVGTWRADLSAYGDEYADIDLFFTLDENGHGVTTMNGVVSADFEAFVYDDGEKGDGKGVYAVFSNIEGAPEWADYAMTVNDAGETVLTLTSDEGVISYVRDESAEVIEISSAEELAAINDNLSGHYVLTADIDLGGAEWMPIGRFEQLGQEGEEAETPNPEAAFTGVFDGQGHTISNLVINQPEGFSVGLFGCASGADIGNFTVENADVTGMVMAGDVVGYAHCSNIHDVTLKGGRVTAVSGEMSGEGMYGGIVAAGMMSVISGCEADCALTLPDSTANAGVIGGGLELTSVIGCRAAGSVTAGEACYGLGGISGCGFGAPEFTDCVAENVTITCGDGCYWIGCITGYAGGYADESFGVPVTVLTGCAARNVTIETGEGAEGVGDIVGAGFYNAAYGETAGAPFDAPTVFEVVNCVRE